MTYNLYLYNKKWKIPEAQISHNFHNALITYTFKRGHLLHYFTFQKDSFFFFYKTLNGLSVLCRYFKLFDFHGVQVFFIHKPYIVSRACSRSSNCFILWIINEKNDVHRHASTINWTPHDIENMVVIAGVRSMRI